MNDPQYTNAGGTGDRTAIITVTTTLSLPAAPYNDPNKLVNGTSANDLYWNNGGSAGQYLRFDFGAAASKLITEAKWIQSSTTSHATYQWQGSDNGSDWTNIGTTFQLGGATTQTITNLSGNTVGYRYYQLLYSSGSNSNSPWLFEMQFKIDDYSAFSITRIPRRRQLVGGGLR